MVSHMNFIRKFWELYTGLRSGGVAFLKCDERGCSHVEYHAKLTHAMVGKPCPRCSSNLLTLEDFRDFSEQQESLVSWD
jgi:hypothetical protein